MPTVYVDGWSPESGGISRVCGRVTSIPLKLFIYVYKNSTGLDIDQFRPDSRAGEYPGALTFDHDDVPTENNNGDVVVAVWAVDTTEGHASFSSPAPCGSPSSSSSSSTTLSSSSSSGPPPQSSSSSSSSVPSSSSSSGPPAQSSSSSTSSTHSSSSSSESVSISSTSSAPTPSIAAPPNG